MKKPLYSIGSIIILLIAAFIFVLLPAFADRAGGARLPNYGSYNGTPIKFEERSEFYKLASQLVSRMEQEGYDFSGEYGKLYYNIAFNQAFNQIVGPMALRDMTTSSGYTVPETEINRSLIEQYYSEAGEYSQAIYNATPEDAKREYLLDTTNMLCAARSYQDLFGSLKRAGNNKLFGLKASDAEIEFLRKMGSKVSNFEFIAFDMRTYPDSEILAWADPNKAKFTNYNLSVITVQEESKAKEVLKRINNSELTFDDAFTTESDKSIGDTETGKVISSYRFQLEDSIENTADQEAVFTMKNGDISQVIKTAAGYAIYRCDGDPVTADFSEKKTFDTASSYLYTREKGHIEDFFMAQANDFVSYAAVSGFDAACEEYGRAKAALPAMALNYNNSSIIGKTDLSSIPALKNTSTNENFLSTAFALKEGEVSKPLVVSSSNTVVVLHCTAINEAGTAKEDAERLLLPEIANADAEVVNSVILNSSKIVNNSDKFMNAFTGGSNF